MTYQIVYQADRETSEIMYREVLAYQDAQGIGLSAALEASPYSTEDLADLRRYIWEEYGIRA